MNSLQEPLKFQDKPSARIKRRIYRLVLGGGMMAVGLLAFSAANYYATNLARIPEYRNSFLSPVMGICFWGGLLLATVGAAVLLTTRRLTER